MIGSTVRKPAIMDESSPWLNLTMITVFSNFELKIHLKFILTIQLIPNCGIFVINFTYFKNTISLNTDMRVDLF